MDVYYRVKFQLCITSGSKVSRGVKKLHPPGIGCVQTSPPGIGLTLFYWGEAIPLILLGGNLSYTLATLNHYRKNAKSLHKSSLR